MVKKIFKRLFSIIAGVDFLYFLFNNSVGKTTNYIQELRKKQIQATDESNETKIIQFAVSKIFPDLTVKNGPFKGLRYAEPKTIGSELFPKLLGSYEKELQPLIKRICNTKYDQILNVGCAEGYYANGLALKMPNSKIYAYDIDTEAVKLCRKMAKINHVEKQVTVRNKCTAKTLYSFLPLNKRTLILSDCEGYEEELFTARVVSKLSKSDFLIEIHDFLNVEISTKIKKIFESTHNIQVISSIDDIKKSQTYNYKEIRNLDINVKKILLSEKRPSIMEWYFMTPL